MPIDRRLLHRVMVVEIALEHKQHDALPHRLFLGAVYARAATLGARQTSPTRIIEAPRVALWIWEYVATRQGRRLIAGWLSNASH